MDWILAVIVVIGWVVGFWLLDKFVTWFVIRMGWTFHTMKERSYLQMHEGTPMWEEEDVKK